MTAKTASLTQKRVPSKSRRVTTIPWRLQLAMLFGFADRPLEFLQAALNYDRELVALPFLGRRFILVNNPSMVREILVKKASSFHRQNSMYRSMRSMFGEATAVSDGEPWRLGHQGLRQVFARLEKGEFSRVTAEAFNSLKHEMPPVTIHKEVNIEPLLSALTLQVITRAIFAEKSAHLAEIHPKILELLELVTQRILAKVQVPLFFPTSKNRHFNRLQNQLRDILGAGIDTSASELLREWQKHLGSRRRLISEIIGVYVAAHGTLTVFLCWTLLYLALHRNWQATIRDELGSGDFRFGDVPDLHSLPKLQAFLTELLRLRPPGWIFSRSLRTDQVICDYWFKKDSLFLISPLLLQQRAEEWQDPVAFKPERFLGEAGKKLKNRMIYNGSFIPFSTGPQMCTGMELAMQEMSTVVAGFLSTYHISTQEKQTGYNARFVLYPQNNLRLTFSPLTGG